MATTRSGDNHSVLNRRSLNAASDVAAVAAVAVTIGAAMGVAPAAMVGAAFAAAIAGGAKLLANRFPDDRKRPTRRRRN